MFIHLFQIYSQSLICIYVIIRLQQEASSRSGNDKLRAPEFSSDDQPIAAKKITEIFDIRFANLPRPVGEVRLIIQVELPITYQAPPRLVATS